MRRSSRILTALLLTTALPGAGLAEMAGAERDAFRAEVRAYLLENPEILNEMVAVLETRQRDAEAIEDADRIAEHRGAIFDDGFSYVGGNPEGDVTIVEFLDYQCSFCRRAHPEVMEMIATDGGIRYVVKELPILGPASETAARVATATLMEHGPEAYARLHDALMRLDGPVTDASVDAALTDAGVDPASVRARLDDPEVERRLAQTRALAADLAIEGTPGFVLDDRMLRGYAPLDAMRAMVSEVRAGG